MRQQRPGPDKQDAAHGGRRHASRSWTTRSALALLTVMAAALATVPAAQADAVYNASVSGSQKVDWHVGGDVTIGACGSGTASLPVLQTATGAGTMSFAFHTAKPGVASASSFRGLSFSFGASARASGSLKASMTLTGGRGGCPGFAPPPDVTAATSACGAQVFGLQLDGQWKNGFVYVTGHDDITFAGASPSSGKYGGCPFPLAPLPSLSRGPGTTACEQAVGAPVWRAENELATFGRGLGNVRIAATPRSLTKPARRATTLTRKVTKHCVIPLNNTTGPITVDVTTRVTITLKRIA